MNYVWVQFPVHQIPIPMKSNAILYCIQLVFHGKGDDACKIINEVAEVNGNLETLEIMLGAFGHANRLMLLPITSMHQQPRPMDTNYMFKLLRNECKHQKLFCDINTCDMVCRTTTRYFDAQVVARKAPMLARLTNTFYKYQQLPKMFPCKPEELYPPTLQTFSSMLVIEVYRQFILKYIYCPRRNNDKPLGDLLHTICYKITTSPSTWFLKFCQGIKNNSDILKTIE